MRANKTQAVCLIRRAMKAGWTREVEASRSLDGTPWNVTVILRNPESPSAKSLHCWAQIIVSFKIASSPGRRNSVRFSTVCEYKKKNQPGYWDAAYQITRWDEFTADDRHNQKLSESLLPPGLLDAIQ